MAFPTIFSQLAAGVEPLSLFDVMFGVVGSMGTVFCTASGTNTIALAPNTNMPTQTAYANYQAYGFVAAATSTGAVTLNVGGLGSRAVYQSDGATPVGSGGIVNGAYYVFVYNSSLNSGVGGFQAFSGGGGGGGGGNGLLTQNIQVITASGTYTPSTGMVYVATRMVGGGGGGAACIGGVAAGSGGGGAEFRFGIFTAAQIGSSQSATVGAAGTAGTSSAGGGTGGTTSLGTLMTAIGGTGGTNGTLAVGGIGGTGGTGGAGIPGGQGGPTSSGTFVVSGAGGDTPLGFGGAGRAASSTTASAGFPGAGYGSGGGGAIQFSSTTQNGGLGAPGVIILVEYLLQTIPSGAAVASSLNGGQLAGFRNPTINGDMRIDQRNNGASQTVTAATSAAYTVDRFYTTCTGANVTGQRVAGSGTQQYQYQFTGATSTTAIAFGQRYEATNVTYLAGNTATFSIVLANSLLTTVTWTAYYPVSTDTWTSRTQIATGNFTVTSTAAAYSAQIALPSNVTTGLEIELTVAAQTSGTWVVGNWQLELGTVATPFERRPLGTELALCQRYYESGSASYEGIGLNTASVGYQLPFKVTKRATPTVATAVTSSSGVSGVIASTIVADSFLWQGAASGSGTFGLFFTGTYTAAAEL